MKSCKQLKTVPTYIHVRKRIKFSFKLQEFELVPCSNITNFSTQKISPPPSFPFLEVISNKYHKMCKNNSVKNHSHFLGSSVKPNSFSNLTEAALPLPLREIEMVQTSVSSEQRQYGILNVIFWHHHKRYIFFKDLITKKVIKVNEGLAWPTKWHHRCFYDSSSFPPKPRLHEICQWPSSDHQNIIKVGVVEVKSESIIIAKKCSTWR